MEQHANGFVSVVLTGAAGAMGSEVLSALLDVPLPLRIRILLRSQADFTPFLKKMLTKRSHSRVEVVMGDLVNEKDCVALIQGADYVLNCAGLIPPKTEHDPHAAYLSDYLAVVNLVDAINKDSRKEEIYFVHIGSVAQYGNRVIANCWGRVGDPMLSSDYDSYSFNKIKAERYVLDNRPPHFVSLRQTAMAHKYLFRNNMKDGLMFQTAFNSTFEWVTDKDTGRLLSQIVVRNEEKNLPDFWNKIYNIGGGQCCRVTGYDSLNDGFHLLGRSLKSFFRPEWMSTRNFHGMYFLDSDVLEEKVPFRHESIADFWKRMGRKYWYFHFGVIVPSALIRAWFFKPLLKKEDAPMYWVEHNMEGHIKAFYGGREAFNAIPRKWKDFPLLADNKKPDGTFIDCDRLKDKAYGIANHLYLNHGYDEKKPWSQWTLSDMKEAAAFRGGQCVSETMVQGDIWTKLRWKCAEGHEFEAAPFTILIGGYWCPDCHRMSPWETGRLAKESPFFGQVYFADHTAAESADVYPLSPNGKD